MHRDDRDATISMTHLQMAPSLANLDEAGVSERTSDVVSGDGGQSLRHVGSGDLDFERSDDRCRARWFTRNVLEVELQCFLEVRERLLH